MNSCAQNIVQQTSDEPKADRAAYRPLVRDEIRILALSPGRMRDPLIGSLRYKTLVGYKEIAYCSDYDGVYEALSYAWGDVVLDHSIELYNHGNIGITSNLYTALQYLRLERETKFLWIDAVCIDQANNAERGSQVDMMGLIFNAADKVLAWIGESNPKATVAFATMSACTTWFNEHNHGVRSFYPWRADTITTLRGCLERKPSCACCQEKAVIEEPVLEQGLLAVASQLRRNYFSRLWVVQEVVRNHNVEIRCGYHKIEWDSFYDCLIGVGDLRHRSEDLAIQSEILRPTLMRWFNDSWHNLRQISVYRQMYQYTYLGDRFLGGLLDFANRSCYDPHDRVYAIAGVYHVSVKKDDLQCDYSRNVLDLYKEITTICFTDTTAGASKPYVSVLLAIAGIESFGRPRLTEEWPSWVPDYHQLSSITRRKMQYYRAGDARGERHPRGNNEAYLDCRISPSNPGHLQLRGHLWGIVIGKISQCPPLMSSDETWKFDVESLISYYVHCYGQLCEEGWPHLARELGAILDTNPAINDVARLDEAGLYSRRAPPDLPEFTKVLQNWLAREWPDEELDIDPSTAYNILLPAMQGKYHAESAVNLFVVHGAGTQRLAWGPCAADRYDHVALCAGALQPLVLRSPSPDGLVLPPKFRLVGDMWVHGISQQDASGILRNGKISSEYSEGLRWITIK